MRTELDQQFEYRGDEEWGRKFWNGFAITIAFGAVISVCLIRLGAFIAEWYYE